MASTRTAKSGALRSPRFLLPVTPRVIRRTMDKRILEHVQREGMASLMNSTKWKVRVKYLLDEEPCSGFTHLDWEWVKHGETSILEWLEIDPVYKTFQGRLIPEKEEDLSEAIFAALKAVGVPFSMEGKLYKVWGYVRASSQPTFV